MQGAGLCTVCWHTRIGRSRKSCFANQLRQDRSHAVGPYRSGSTDLRLQLLRWRTCAAAASDPRVVCCLGSEHGWTTVATQPLHDESGYTRTNTCWRVLCRAQKLMAAGSWTSAHNLLTATYEGFHHFDDSAGCRLECFHCYSTEQAAHQTGPRCIVDEQA